MTSFSSSPYPRQLDQLQVLPHRGRDGGRVGRRHDPHRGQVEGGVEVLVTERLPAGRVQDARQGIGGLRVHPVECVEHEHRVGHPGVVQAAGDAAGGAVAHPAEQGLGIATVQRHVHEGAVERRGDGHRQRQLPRAVGAGQAEDGSRPGAHDQRGRYARLGCPAAAHAFDGERAVRLRARRQHVDDAGLHLLEAAVRTVQRVFELRPVEALRLARAPRHREQHLRPVQHVLEGVRLGLERLPQRAPQRLAHPVGQLGALQRAERLVDARAQGATSARTSASADAAEPLLRGGPRLDAAVGRRLVHGIGLGGPVDEQAEHLRLVHEASLPAGRQVGQPPPLALRHGGDHAAAVGGPESLPARVMATAAGHAGQVAPRPSAPCRTHSSSADRPAAPCRRRRPPVAVSRACCLSSRSGHLHPWRQRQRSRRRRLVTVPLFVCPSAVPFRLLPVVFSLPVLSGRTAAGPSVAPVVSDTGAVWRGCRSVRRLGASVRRQADSPARRFTPYGDTDGSAAGGNDAVATDGPARCDAPVVARARPDRWRGSVRGPLLRFERRGPAGHIGGGGAYPCHGRGWRSTAGCVPGLRLQHAVTQVVMNALGPRLRGDSGPGGGRSTGDRGRGGRRRGHQVGAPCS